MGENTIPIQRKHLPSLDVVRGMAILSVFLYHLLSSVWGYDHLDWGKFFHKRPIYGDGFLWFYPLTYGWIGVSLFFVLSGFVIHYSSVTSSRQPSTLSFYSRRFWRIYPPYAVALLLFCLWHGGGYSVTSLSVITHALLIQDFSGQTFYLINPSFWSIATEVQFYLVYPLLIFARGRVGMFKVLMGVLSFSLLSRMAFCILKLRHSSDVFDDTHHMIWASPMITIFDWTLGAYLAECFARGKRVFPQGTGWILAMIGVFLISSFVRPLSIFSFQIASILAAVYIERVIWSTKPLWFIQKLLIPLGLCSYSFYLVHQPVMVFLIHQTQQHMTTNRYALMLGAGPVIFGLLCCISWVMYMSVEKTSIHIGKRFSFRTKLDAQPGVESGVKKDQSPAAPAVV